MNRPSNPTPVGNNCGIEGHSGSCGTRPTRSCPGKSTKEGTNNG